MEPVDFERVQLPTLHVIDKLDIWFALWLVCLVVSLNFFFI